jgi:hypothetical protein
MQEVEKTFSVSFSPNSALPDIIKVMTTTMTKGSYVQHTPYQSIAAPSRSVFLVVEEILLAASQPLTATEITEAVSRKLDKAFTENPIRLVLGELNSLRTISSRVETHRERVTRANDENVRSSRAALYWAPYADGIVPERTMTEVIPGLILFQKELYPKRSVSNAATKKKRREEAKRAYKNKKAKTLSREAYSITNDATTVSNPVIDYLIEKIVTEKTAELTKTLKETQAELSRLRGFLKSAIGN